MILEFPITPHMIRRLEKRKQEEMDAWNRLYDDLYYRGTRFTTI